MDAAILLTCINNNERGRASICVKKQNKFGVKVNNDAHDSMCGYILDKIEKAAPL